MPQIDRVESDRGFLKVLWRDGAAFDFHALWLRDNCRCPACGVAEIGRRTLRLTDIPLDIGLMESRVDAAGQDVYLAWSDGHRGQFSGDWLKAHAYGEKTRRDRGFSPRLWSDEIRRDPPSLDFGSVASSEPAFLNMLERVRDYGLCFLRAGPVEPGALEVLAGRIGPPQESNFGRIQDLVVDASRRSIANSTEPLKPHTDEPYRASPPGILLFHCLASDVTGGGASTFMDGFEIAATLRREDPEGFAALARHNHGFRRHFEGDVDLIAEFPVISTDAFGAVTGVRVNDRVAAPLAIPAAAVPCYYRGLKRLLELAEDEARMIRLTLRPGTIAIFDNHRVLHGRQGFTLTGRRRLQWAQVERGCFHSRLRILADKLGQPRDATPLLRGAYG